MSWEMEPICALGRIITGKTPPTKQRRYFDGPYPFITPTDLDYDSYRVSGTETTVSDEAKAKFRNQFLPPDAVTFTCIASVGKIGITASDSLTNQQINSIVVNDAHDFRFVYYLLRNNARRILGMCSGVATPIINKNDFGKVEVQVPNDLAAEQRIASILSAYDDLIANSRRRIQLLEDAARLLYREWFVCLRFPGHEHAKIRDGIPEGWEKVTLGHLCEEVREMCSPAALEPDTPYIGLEHMPRRSIALAEWGVAEEVTSSKHRFLEGEILFGKIRPYFHKVGIALTDGIASSDAIIIRPCSRELMPLVLLTVSSDSFVADTAQKMKEGSKMPRADWGQMQAYPVLHPAAGILSAFNAVVEPILAQIRTLVFQIRNLARARDLLLPKLMSGEIAV